MERGQIRVPPFIGEQRSMHTQCGRGHTRDLPHTRCDRGRSNSCTRLYASTQARTLHRRATWRANNRRCARKKVLRVSGFHSGPPLDVYPLVTVVNIRRSAITPVIAAQDTAQPQASFTPHMSPQPTFVNSSHESTAHMRQQHNTAQSLFTAHGSPQLT
jgi:hypothetical protein